MKLQLIWVKGVVYQYGGPRSSMSAARSCMEWLYITLWEIWLLPTHFPILAISGGLSDWVINTS